MQSAAAYLQAGRELRCLRVQEGFDPPSERVWFRKLQSRGIENLTNIPFPSVALSGALVDPCPPSLFVCVCMNVQVWGFTTADTEMGARLERLRKTLRGKTTRPL